MSIETKKRKRKDSRPNVFEQTRAAAKKHVDKNNINPLLLKQFESSVNKVEQLFPKNIIYSVTRRIYKYTNEIFGHIMIAFEMYGTFNDKNEMTSNPYAEENKLQLLTLFVQTIFPFFKRAWHQKKDIDKIFYPISINSLITEGYRYKNENLIQYSGIAKTILKYNTDKNLDLKFIDRFLIKKNAEESTIYFQFEFTNLRHSSLNSIYLFIEYLNSVVPESTRLMSVKSGTIIAKIRSYFKSDKAREDAMEALEDLKKYKKGKLTKDFGEVEKLRTETEKIEVEKQIKEKELSDLESIQSEYNKSLDTKLKELEIEKRELENESKRIQNFASKKELLKEMLTESLISEEQYQLLLNGESFMNYSNNLLSNEYKDIHDMENSKNEEE